MSSSTRIRAQDRKAYVSLAFSSPVQLPFLPKNPKPYLISPHTRPSSLGFISYRGRGAWISMSKSPTFIVPPPERRGRECPSILDYIFSKASSFLKFVHTDPLKENACSDACTGENRLPLQQEGES
jgi:hypothetical protein